MEEVDTRDFVPCLQRGQITIYIGLIFGKEIFMEKCLADTYSPVFNDANSVSELQEGNSQDSWHQVHGSRVLSSI